MRPHFRFLGLGNLEGAFPIVSAIASNVGSVLAMPALMVCVLTNEICHAEETLS